MKKFDVLNRDTPFKGPLLLEASAGTGKTFTLQHLFVRHLLDGCQVQEIVVITFTRAATRELKNRLRKGIKEALNNLTSEGQVLDYLIPHQTPEAIELLRRALSDIDLTPIRTIHGFLGELLNRFAWEGHRPLSKATIGALPVLEEKIQTIRDYLRSQEAKNNHLPYEEELLFSISDFELEVAKSMDGGVEPSSIDLREALSKLSSISWSRELLLDLPKWFKKGRKGDGSEWMHALADVLEGQQELNHLLSQGSPLKGVLEDEHRLKRIPKDALFNEEVLCVLREEIIPETARLTDKKYVISRYAAAVYPHYKERTKELGPDDLLSEVGDLVDIALFADSIRAAYKVVLVDEFQDTDPIQWKILSTLFLHPSWEGTLTLVGDPKQAIYRFRKADLYTYFEAKRAIGVSNCYQLTHNFRSHPLLLRTLNHLFSSAPLLRLPTLGEEHSYIPVDAGISPYSLGYAPLTLVEAENEAILFEWMASELHQFKEESVAFLVKDRFQAERLKQSLEEQGIISRLYRTPTWENDDLLASIHTFFKALEHPESRDRITHLFATPFFREILFERTEIEVAQAMSDLSRLQNLYLKLGAPAVFEALLPLGWQGKSFGSWILQQEEGELLFERIQRLFLEIEKGVPSHRFLDVYTFILRLHIGLERQEAEERGIVTSGCPLIMTIHMSKGLEFDVVFAPGVSAALSKGDLEDEAEALRQLYVALTRPKKKLYLPLTGKKGNGLSSLDLFIERSGKESFIARMLEEEGVEYVIATSPETPIQHQKAIAKKPLPPVQLELPPSAPPLLSFSSIREKGHRERTLSNPGGSDFGTELHELLAKVSLQDVRAGNIHHSSPQMVELALKSYKTPLVTPWGTFSLEEVDEEKMIREGEFLFIDEEKGIFTGFIDVAFEHLGKLFLVDWKSHLLSTYHQSSLDEEMRVGDYITQERLYRTALKHHIGPTFDDRFGGSFFLFVRGLQPSGEGVWYAP